MPESFPQRTRTTSRLAFSALFVAALGLILAVIFHSSFASGLVLFANDAPLGALTAYFPNAWTFFTGAWHNLNWVGGPTPSALPNLTYTLFLILEPVLYSKFIAPLSLLYLGFAAYLFFRSLGFAPVICLLGGIAAALNTDPFSYACWGLASLPLTTGSIFLALAALAPSPRPWLRAALGGFAVGLAIMEGYDNGAILSLYVAAAVLFQSALDPRPPKQWLWRGPLRVALVAICAAIISAQALITLVGTQVKDVAVAEPNNLTPQQQWNFATQWSLPKIEALRIVIPGLFGYRMDTPEGGVYWGRVGETPGWEEHHQGSPRHSGAGTYTGVLVALIALWACAQSARKKASIYTPAERRFIWFWAAVAVISLLFAFGRHAPFYHLVYSLPYFSTIRNPIKYLHPFHIGLVILFGYGLEGLYRAYLQRTYSGATLGASLQTWWAGATRFEKRWNISVIITLGITCLSWLIYVSSRTELETYLKNHAFSPADAAQIASFSFFEVGWFLLLLLLSAIALLLIMSGWLSGVRARYATVMLGAILLLDLGRANQPWIIYYDYQEKYASNSILDFLKEKQFDQRVTAKVFPSGANYLAFTPQYAQVFAGLQNEWLQHQFQFYRIPSLDIIQMPREPEIDAAFRAALTPTTNTQYRLIPRLWELTGTRYLLGDTAALPFLDHQLDGGRNRFSAARPFTLVPKQGRTNAVRLEDITTEFTTNGPFAVFEFSGALRRVQLFDRWETITNNAAALERLVSPEFKPSELVLLSTPVPAAPNSPGTNAPPGAAELVSYTPKRVAIRAAPARPSVLLLSDKFAPDWKVRVDGREQPLLRCNFIMRGVLLEPGQHDVVFSYEPPVTGLYISLAGVAAALIICGLLGLNRPRPETTSPAPGPGPK